MKGCRPLTDNEVEHVLASFSGVYQNRDRALFVLGMKSGFRITEILSLRVRDIIQNGKVVEQVTVARRSMKGKTEGRTVKLNPQARQELLTWLKDLSSLVTLSDDTYVFQSRKGTNKAISRVQAYQIFDAAFTSCQLTGKLGTHSMRKTFANKAYDYFKGDLAKVQKAMGHKNINSTVQYISFREEEIDEFVMAM